jgi:hypothetical protein
MAVPNGQVWRGVRQSLLGLLGHCDRPGPQFFHLRSPSSLGGRTPYVIYIEIASDPSRPELTITEPV